MSFFIEECYFRIWPKDITGLLMRFVEKQFLQDSRADEFVIISRERYVKYFLHNQLKWCSAFSADKVDVLIWEDAIIIVSDSLVDQAITGRKYTATFFSKCTGTCYINIPLSFAEIKHPVVIHNSRFVNNAEDRWTY